MLTTKLSTRTKEVLSEKLVEWYPHAPEWRPLETGNHQVLDIPVIHIWDEAAQIYQHCERAAEEFSAFSPIAKYCVRFGPLYAESFE